MNFGELSQIPGFFPHMISKGDIQTTDSDKGMQSDKDCVCVWGGLCVCFFYSINNVSPGAILLLQFWEVGVYRFHLGEEADVMQEKFLPVTGMAGKEESPESRL